MGIFGSSYEDKSIAVNESAIDEWAQKFTDNVVYDERFDTVAYMPGEESALMDVVDEEQAVNHLLTGVGTARYDQVATSDSVMDVLFTIGANMGAAVSIAAEEYVSDLSQGGRKQLYEQVRRTEFGEADYRPHSITKNPDFKNGLYFGINTYDELLSAEEGSLIEDALTYSRVTVNQV